MNSELNEIEETSGVINNFDEWRSIITESKGPHLLAGTHFDFENAKLLVDRCNIKYFMEDPVVLFENRAVTAFSAKSSSIDEIAEEFNKLANEGVQVFLYMLMNCTFDPSGKSWVVRYGKL